MRDVEREEEDSRHWLVAVCSGGHVQMLHASQSRTPCPVCRGGPPGADAPSYAYPCKHCGGMLHEHAKKHCLFAPTCFEPVSVEELQRW